MIMVTGRSAKDWREENVTSNFKEDLGTFRPVSLILIPGKVIEQLNLENISKHTRRTRKSGIVSKGSPKGSHA